MASMHLPIRLREEELRKQLAQEKQQQEAKAQQVKDKGKTEEGLHKLKQEEDKRKKEQQTQVDIEVRGHYKVPGSFCFCCLNTVSTIGFRFLVSSCEFQVAYCVKYVFSSLFEQKEKARFQSQEDAERQRQDRELQTQQEEEERQLRKKVILKRKTDKENMCADCLCKSDVL